MKLKKIAALGMAACLALAMCACSAEGEPVPSDTVPSQGVTEPSTTPDSNPNPDVTFGLQTPPDPNFDSPATGDDSGKLYTIVGDYAYELDPTTLEPIGDPLDPITHEPVDNPVLEGNNPSTPNNPQNTPAPEASDPPVQATPPVTDPAPSNTPDTSLPNMGMFLEDD